MNAGYEAAPPGPGEQRVIPAGEMDTLITTEREHTESELDGVDEKLDQFVEVAEKHRTRMLRLARRFTPCREEAEDIVQDAFLKAFRALPRFRGESRMDTWLQTIVRNTVCDYLRAGRGKVYLPLEVTTSNSHDETEVCVRDVPDPARNPEERMELKEMESILSSEIERLTPVCREAIRLCALEELSHARAARTLQISTPTVKARVFRGRDLLKRAVRKYASRPGLPAAPQSGFVQ